MNRKFYLLTFTLLLFTFAKTQVQTTLLQNFANPALFNLNDSACLNVSGEWLGEETEYTDQYNHEKGRYAIRFVLAQQGNKVSGHSIISFNNGNDYGNMKIRGLVVGNKLYFEEYEVVEQKFSSAGVTWCLRTGELDIETKGNSLILSGANYKGYATYYYFNCQAPVSMNLTKSLTVKEAQSIQKNKSITDAGSMKLQPNPANSEVTVVFTITEDAPVNVDIYSLAGELIGSITKEFYKAGTHQQLFSLHNYMAGAYLIRMQTGTKNYAKILVISR